MSAATLARDLVVAQTRALKLPGVEAFYAYPASDDGGSPVGVGGGRHLAGPGMRVGFALVVAGAACAVTLVIAWVYVWLRYYAFL